MAGGPGAAGVPASSARSPPRPHALSGFRVGRAEGWRRGGGRRRKEATGRRPLPRSPGLSGSRRRPPRQPLLLVPGAAAQPRSPEAAALPVCSPSAPKKARLARAGRREAAAVLARVRRTASAAEGIPAPSLQPPPTPRFSLPPRRTPAARRTCRWIREGWRAAGPGAGAGAGSPQPPPHAGRSGESQARTGGEMKPVRSLFRAALPAERERQEGETGVEGTG